MALVGDGGKERSVSGNRALAAVNGGGGAQASLCVVVGIGLGL